MEDHETVENAKEIPSDFVIPTFSKSTNEETKSADDEINKKMEIIEVPTKKPKSEKQPRYNNDNDKANDEIDYMHELSDELKEWKQDLENSTGSFKGYNPYDYDPYFKELRRLVLEQRAYYKKYKANKDENKQVKMYLKNDNMMNKVIELANYLIPRIKWQTYKTTPGLKPDSMVNVIHSLKTDPDLIGRFKFNEFTQWPDSIDKVVQPPLYLDKKPLDDFQINSISDYLNFSNNVLFKTDLIYRGVLSVSREYPYHPLKERIERKEWDGIERLDTVFIDYLGAEDTDLNRLITRTWFCGLIKRIYKPGCKFELMPILTGPQGRGKSSLVKAIMPDYYKNGLQKMDSTHQNTAINLLNNAVIEIAELSAFKASQIEAVKDFLSTEVDKIRMPYGRNDITVPRHVVFIGTTNQNNFLKDKTGNRRFPTIKIGVQEAKKSPFHVDEYEMQQVLAEAKVALENGQDTYLDKKVEKEIAETQEDAMIIDEKEILIKKFLDMPVPDDWEDYNLYEKQNYFTRWNDNGDLWPRFIDKDNEDARKDEIEQFNPTNKISEFAVTDVLKIVFKRDSSNTQKDGLPSVVKTILDNTLDPAPRKTGAKWSYVHSEFKAQGDPKPRKQRHYKFNG